MESLGDFPKANGWMPEWGPRQLTPESVLVATMLFWGFFGLFVCFFFF